MPEIDWVDLIKRLQEDLAWRRHSGWRHQRVNEKAWSAVEDLLIRQARSSLVKSSIIQPQDVEDVVQQVLMKMQSEEVINRLAASGSPGGYIAMMLRNATVDLLRRRIRERDVFETFDELKPPKVTVFVDEEEGEEVKFHSAELRRALSELSTKERELLQLRFWKSMSIQQIATKLGISYSAAAVRLFRALRRLREGLKTC
jgi:RNA polymerase sigma factor (sigma-70 family)